jgi:hypothetical protein
MLSQMNLIRFSMILMIGIITSIFIPDFYWKANKREANRTNVNYSPVTKSFVLLKSDVRGATYTDPQGKIYSRDEFEQLVPFMNFRQLMATGKLPDSLNGVALVPKEISINNLTLRVLPATINSRPLQIYPLMESASGRVRLELPPDYFRIKGRMEFITSQTNEVNEEKSELFTQALKKEGFQFPSKFIYGNPSTKKPFDEGYFVIDRDNYVFHIKMVKGIPFCKKTPIPSTLDIVYMAINETELREFYGLFVTRSNEAYLISYKNYQLIKLPLLGYDHQNDMLQFRGDLFYRTLVLNKENGLEVVITDRNYQVIDKYSEKKPTSEETTAGIIAAYLFPFTIEIEKFNTPFINFYFTLSDARCLILSFLLAGITIFYLKRREIGVKQGAIYYLWVLLTGLFGFIGILAVRDFKNDPVSKNQD